MTVLNEVEAVLTRKKDAVFALANKATTTEERNRLFSKGNAINFGVNVLDYNRRLNTTDENVLVRTMNNVARCIQPDTEPAYKDGLEIALETIKAEFLVEFPIHAGAR